MTQSLNNSGHKAVINPQQWKLPDPTRVIGALKSRKESGVADTPKGSRWTFSKNIVPVDLYGYLKLRFGPPNGFAMTLRSSSVDNLIHWNYTLECPDSIIDLHGMDTEINVTAYTAILDDLGWKALESNLLSEFKQNQKALASVKQEFEKWHLFVNPYRRLTGIVDRFEQRLNQIVLPTVKSPSIPST